MKRREILLKRFLYRNDKKMQSKCFSIEHIHEHPKKGRTDVR